MSITLFGKSVLDNAGVTITTTATATGFGKERLNDRDRSPLMKANASGQFDVDIVLPSGGSVSALAIINHNQTASIEIYSDSASAIGTTLVATLAPSFADPFVGTFALQSQTKYRVRFLSFGGVLQVGELLLGVPRTITQNPIIRQSGRFTIGNVKRFRSPGGYAWAVQKSAARVRLPYGWTAMPAADLVTYEAAYADVSEGAKNLLVKDVLDVYRWMSWTDETLEPVPVDRNATDGLLYETKAVFEEAF